MTALYRRMTPEQRLEMGIRMVALDRVGAERLVAQLGLGGLGSRLHPTSSGE